MGCCHSRIEKANKATSVKVTPDVVYSKSICTAKPENPSDVQALVSSAGWMADADYGDYSQIIEGNDRAIFACLFDPHSTTDAASFCITHCHSIFVTAMKQCNRDPEKALEKTFKELDRQFLNSKLNPNIRATSGCSGVVAYVDVSQKKFWIANVGTCRALIGVSEGAFNARNMDGKAIVDGHDIENPAERERLYASFPSETENLLQTVNGETLLKGITKYTRCIGFGFAKDPKLADVCNEEKMKQIWPLSKTKNPYIIPDPQIEVFELKHGFEKLVLYSEGMGQLLSPSEMAIYSMHFDANTLTELAETYLKDVNGMDRRKEKTPNKQSQAVALVRHAVAKAADNFAMLVNTIRLSMKDKKVATKFVNVEDVRSLKCSNTLEGETNKPGSICRKDLHENLACVVISLESPEMKKRLFSVASKANTAPPIVRYRWKLLQLYCKFRIQCRRACLRRWWQLISLAVREEQRRFLEQEKAEWLKASKGVIEETPVTNGGIQINDSTQAKSSSVFASRMSSGFRKWLETPAIKGQVNHDLSLSPLFVYRFGGLWKDAEYSACRVLCL